MPQLRVEPVTLYSPTPVESREVLVTTGKRRPQPVFGPRVCRPVVVSGAVVVYSHELWCSPVEITTDSSLEIVGSVEIAL